MRRHDALPSADTTIRERDRAPVDGNTPADYPLLARCESCHREIRIEAASEVAELDDFQVIAERRQVSETIATLIDRHSKLNEEMTRRATLRWMLP